MRNWFVMVWLGMAVVMPLPAAIVLQPVEPELEALAGLTEAKAALQKEDYKKAIRLFAKEAEAGNGAAMFALGYMNHKGLGLPASPMVAESFYRQAIKMGSIPAMFNLAAILLSRPEGVAEGFEWMEKAAVAGSGRAALTLGRMLAADPKGGDGKNPARAEEWLRRAARTPELKGEASFALAQFLDPELKGEGERGKESKELLQQAVESGYPPALFALSDHYLRQKTGAEKAVPLLEEARAKGSPEAAFRLAMLHEEGRVVKADLVAAAKLYQEAAQAGHALAANQLAAMYQEGRGVAADVKQAYAWFLRAAELGLPMAQFNTGVCLENGQGVEKNEAEACQWYYRAALAGYAPAQNRLAIRYQDGQGVMRDLVAARAWLREAASRGFEAAILNYADLLATGQGGPADLPGALELYQGLAARGNARALHAWGNLVETGAAGPPDPAKALALQQLAAPHYEPAKVKAEALAQALSEDVKAQAGEYMKNPQTLFPMAPAGSSKNTEEAASGC